MSRRGVGKFSIFTSWFHPRPTKAYSEGYDRTFGRQEDKPPVEKTSQIGGSPFKKEILKFRESWERTFGKAKRR